MKEKNTKKWSYLTVEFPDNFTKEHVEEFGKYLQYILSINNKGIVVKKVDCVSNQ